jgi:hypothetical protein
MLFFKGVELDRLDRSRGGTGAILSNA